MENIKRINHLLPVLIFTFIIIFAYQDLPKTFFQQDEWGGLGYNLYLRSLGPKEMVLKIWQDVRSLGLSHFPPVLILLNFLQYYFFGTNFFPYALVSLIFHLSNTILVFWLASILFKKPELSFTTSLLFAVNSISHQAVSWVASSLNTQGCCFFLLLSLIFLLKKLPFLSILALAISLGFKEASFFLFIFLPLVWLIFIKKDKLTFKKLLVPFFIFGLFYISLRLFLLLNAPPVPGEQVKALSQPDKVVWLFRLILLPLRAFPQSIISAGQIISWAEKIVELAYPHFQGQISTTYYDLITQTITTDLVCLSLSVFILFASVIFFNYLNNWREKNLAKALIFAITFIPLSSLPFVFIPGKAGYFSIFEPRHLYISLIGSSVLITLFLFAVSSWLGKKTSKPLYLYFLLFLIPILFFHIKNIRGDLNILVARSQTRKEILITIKNSYPDLPQKAVFYVESDTAYYGLPPEDKTLPFQTGPGRMLLVWYYDQEKFPPCFFEDQFLHGLPSSQGYRFCQERGFGYFREYDKLKETLKEHQLSADNVFAFSWKEETEEFKNITDQLREELK